MACIQIDSAEWETSERRLMNRSVKFHPTLTIDGQMRPLWPPSDEMPDCLRMRMKDGYDEDRARLSIMAADPSDVYQWTCKGLKHTC